MKKITILLYLLIVVTASAWIYCTNRGPSVKLVATRSLPVDHPLEPDDLQLKVDGRQYLARSIKEGETVDSGDIGTLDDIVTINGVPIDVEISRNTMISRKIDPGDVIYLCPLNVKVKVRAAYCGDPSAPCIVVATAAVKDAEKLKAAAKEASVRMGDTCK